jgi:uncharacterized protein (UPF0548 family)
LFFVRRPPVAFIQKFLDQQTMLPFSYKEVGATASGPPAGYAVDRTRASLGHGAQVFERARQGLRRWGQFELGWLSAWPNDTPLEAGRCVAVIAHTFGLWSLSAARIVYVVDEPGRFGFAYGTLPGHVEKGEERFAIEQAAGGEVFYDVLAFSRAQHPLAKIGYPLVRRLQKRFGRDSVAAMRRLVRE